MFNFTSEDSEDPKTRRRRMMIELIKYADSKYYSKKEIAEFCGIHVKTLYYLERKHPELDFMIHRRYKTIYDKPHLWVTKEI